VRTGLTRIAPECAVAAVVAAKIRQGKKHFAGIGDDSRLESGAGKLRGREQRWQHVVIRSQQPASRFPRDWLGACVGQIISHRGQRIWEDSGHAFLPGNSLHPNPSQLLSGAATIVPAIVLATMITDIANPCPAGQTAPATFDLAICGSVVPLPGGLPSWPASIQRNAIRDGKIHHGIVQSEVIRSHAQNRGQQVSA
jgi:hypothetical protein